MSEILQEVDNQWCWATIVALQAVDTSTGHFRHILVNFVIREGAEVPTLIR
jgi:hypothetical protein